MKKRNKHRLETNFRKARQMKKKTIVCRGSQLEAEKDGKDDTLGADS